MIFLCLSLGCSDRLDLLIALDDSQRIGEVGFQKTKEFVKTLLEWFNINQNGTNIAAMTYSDTAVEHFNFPVRGKYAPYFMDLIIQNKVF